MVYNVIGLMSGSSLDGLDVAFVELTEIGGEWSFELIESATLEYDHYWNEQLKNAPNLKLDDFLRLHTAYGRYLGVKIDEFIQHHNLVHKVHFVSSHGHTVFHDPKNHTSFQIGDGASIAAYCNLPVITDLRNKDVALGGQGAPIVPIAEQLLWKDFAYCLNIGGIANITMNGENPIAFDICPANQVLNFFAQKTGKNYDDNGDIAKSGVVNDEVLQQLSQLEYYQQSAPKSLANTYSQELINQLNVLKTKDALATMCQHIADELAKSIQLFSSIENAKILITGGGALNGHLIDCIKKALPNIEVIIPAKEIIDYKEAIAMALIGALRWREEANVLSSVTGAKNNSVGGALWVN